MEGMRNMQETEPIKLRQRAVGGGYRKPGEEVIWDKGFWSFVKDCFVWSDADVLLVPVIVFKASCGLAPAVMTDLITELDNASGIAPLVVITFADEYKGDIQQLKEDFATLHCPHVFIVTCYNKENKEDRDDALDKILLDFLVACTDVAEKTLRFKCSIK
eukprot:gi/632972167/ref/XP_007902527.1/ PREDICTED: uncharacterized protein LOC103185698 isoform X1 [Callorhinchus milii]